MTELQHKEPELVNPEDLVPYHNNPKSHPTEQIDKIASSIKNYGFIQPIVTDQDNEVIIGHGRLQAAKKLDFFAGSGSTLLAAEQTDRKAYCMELEPKYCQVIIDRWEDLTGKKAEPVE